LRIIFITLMSSRRRVSRSGPKQWGDSPTNGSFGWLTIQTGSFVASDPSVVSSASTVVSGRFPIISLAFTSARRQATSEIRRPTPRTPVRASAVGRVPSRSVLAMRTMYRKFGLSGMILVVLPGAPGFDLPFDSLASFGSFPLPGFSFRAAFSAPGPGPASAAVAAGSAGASFGSLGATVTPLGVEPHRKGANGRTDAGFDPLHRGRGRRESRAS